MTHRNILLALSLFALPLFTAASAHAQTATDRNDSALNTMPAQSVLEDDGASHTLRVRRHHTHWMTALGGASFATSYGLTAAGGAFIALFGYNGATEGLPLLMPVVGPAWSAYNCGRYVANCDVGQAWGIAAIGTLLQAAPIALYIAGMIGSRETPLVAREHTPHGVRAQWMVTPGAGTALVGASLTLSL